MNFKVLLPLSLVAILSGCSKELTTPQGNIQFIEYPNTTITIGDKLSSISHLTYNYSTKERNFKIDFYIDKFPYYKTFNSCPNVDIKNYECRSWISINKYNGLKGFVFAQNINVFTGHFISNKTKEKSLTNIKDQRSPTLLLKEFDNTIIRDTFLGTEEISWKINN